MLAARNAAGIDSQRDSSLVNFSNERLAAQQSAALAGLQNLSKQRRDMENISNTRSAIGLGTVNSILSGLFR